jgi:DNA-binding CsgD family transcriptional regulator
VDEALYTVKHVEGWFEPFAAIYELKMMLHWHDRQFDKVEPLLANIIAIQHVGNLLESFTHALRFRFELLQGRTKEAQFVVDSFRLDTRWRAPNYQDEFTYREWDLVGICLCLLAVHCRAFSLAIEIVDRLDQVAQLTGRGRVIAKAAVLRAIIAFQQGDEDRAVIQMLCATEFGYAQGYCRIFLDEAEFVRPIFATMKSRTNSLPTHLAPYILKLCKTLLRGDKRTNSNDACILSEREREVLREVGYGNSNKVIARKLDLSAPTVSFHLRNIYQKLGVRRRASAISEAHLRGWLP